MSQHEDGQLVSLFEVVKLYHQPPCGITFLHGAAQIGKVVNDKNLAGGLQCHLLDAADNGFLKIFLQQ